MVTPIPTLIDKQDTFEIMGDQIAAILDINQANQVALATADGKPNPEDWKLRVRRERSEPFEDWLNSDANTLPTTDKSIIVNIWWESSNFPEGQGNVVERQKSESVYNIDIYGVGYAQDDSSGTGHLVADEQAALANQRGVRFVRNILMAAENTYLQARGLVWKRWPQSITSFQPTLDGRPNQRVVASRMAFAVDFNEFSPQVEGQLSELIAVQLKRGPDGFVYVDANYEYPLP